MEKEKIPVVKFNNKSVIWTVIHTSSNVEQVAHEGETLHVLYSDKKYVYHYSPISEKQYNKFIAAESKGSWLHENVKTNKALKVTKSEWEFKR